VKKFLGILLVGMMVISLGLAGCGQKQASKPTDTPVKAEPITLTFWHTMNTEETETLADIVKDFETKNSGIKIEMQQVPFSDAQNKYKVAAQAGNAPDVFRAEIAWTPEYAAMGLLLPVDNFLSAEDRADYLPAPMKYNIYNGKTWGVPQVTDALALLYNKRMFKEAGIEAPPQTMDEFVAIAKKLTNPAKGQYGFVLRGDSYWFQPFLWAFGGGLIDENKNIFINTPAAVEGLKFMIDLRDRYQVVPKDIDYANDYVNMMTGFKEGKFAMIFNGPWATSDILGGKEFQDKANFGVAPIPKGPKGQGSPVGGHNYVISANTKNAEAAWKFITHINSKENQAKFAVRNNLLPTRRSAYEDPAVKANEILQGFKAQMEVATNRPVIPEGGAIYTDFTPNIQAALSKKLKPEEALANIEAAWQKLLKK